MLRLKLDKIEKQTARLHFLYSILEGAILGILALNEYAFIKSMHGSNYQLGFLFQFSAVVFLLSVFINEFLKREKNKKKLLRRTAIITRLPLLILFFFPKNTEAYINNPVYHYVYLSIFLIYYLATPIVFPTINLLLKKNYTHTNFGKLFSYATAANKIVMLFFTFLFGLLLDINPFSFTYIIPIVGIFGIVSLFLLSDIKYKTFEIKTHQLSLFQSVKSSILDMVGVLKVNVPFRHFEMGFMFYGFAFMVTYPIITIFYEQILDLNYSSVAFYRNAYYTVSIVTLPLFGKILGKIDPRKFGVFTFLSIMLFIFFIAATNFFPHYTEIKGIKLYYLMIPYVLFHGIFAATMGLLWPIGSAYYCKAEEAATYQGVHLGLTGVRALFAPVLGVFFYERYGFTITFAIAVFSLLIGIVIMYWSYVRDRKKQLYTNKMNNSSTSQV